VAAVPHRERLSRAAKAADKRRVLSEVRKHEFTRRPPHGEQAKVRQSRRSRGCLFLWCLSFGRAKERHTPEGRKKHQCNRQRISNEWIPRPATSRRMTRLTAPRRMTFLV